MQRLLLPFLLFICSLTPESTWAQDIKPVTANAPVVVQKTTKTITPTTYAGRQVVVGSGGGVTGSSTAYYLLENGQLFGRRSRDTAYTFIGKQTAVNTKRVFATAEGKCKIKTTTFSNPGNLYKFVRWRRGKELYKVTWGGAGATVPANYAKFYDSFMAMIPASARL